MVPWEEAAPLATRLASSLSPLLTVTQGGEGSENPVLFVDAVSRSKAALRADPSPTSFPCGSMPVVEGQTRNSYGAEPVLTTPLKAL